MFNHLIESAPRRRGNRSTAAGTMASLALHGAMALGAAYATMQSEAALRPVTTEPVPVVLVGEPKHEPEPKEPPARPAVPDMAPPSPLGFKVIDPPAIVPSELPPVDWDTDFNPRDYRGLGVPGGVFDGVHGLSGVHASPVFDVLGVDEPPERIAGPLPRFPEVLRQAGVEGRVVLQFVIDTTGLVDAATIEVLETTHRAFVAPAVVVVTRSVFRPGRIRGRAVRVLVRLPIGFALDATGR